MPWSTRTTLRRASAQSRSCRSSRTRRADSSVRARPSAFSATPSRERRVAAGEVGGIARGATAKFVEHRFEFGVRHPSPCGDASAAPTDRRPVWASVDAVRGSSTRTVVPAPGALSSPTSPPWAIDDRPHDREAESRPAGVARPRRVGTRRTARTHGPTTSGVMPGPSSWTSTTALPRCRCGPGPTPACRRACARARCRPGWPTTWRSRSSSPSTVTVVGDVGSDVPVGRDRTRVGGGVDGEHAEVDRARARAGGPRRAVPAAAGRRPAPPCARPPARCGAWPGRGRRVRRGHRAGTARRSPGSS